MIGQGLIVRVGAVYAFVLPACLLALLGGCAVTPPPPPEPIIITQKVPTPVPSPCVPANLGSAPEYPDTDAALRAAFGPTERYQLVAAGRPLRIARLKDLETVVAGCPRVGQ